MLVETTMKYYDKKYDLNCAECMLVAVNEVYDLNISKQTLMLSLIHISEPTRRS